jgi:hypothetical protein
MAEKKKDKQKTVKKQKPKKPNQRQQVRQKIKAAGQRSFQKTSNDKLRSLPKRDLLTRKWPTL